MMLNKPYRYDYFIIWGNGLSKKVEILDILRNEEYLEVILIESKKIKRMKKFIFSLYACDTVPIEHLKSKLKYLFKVKKEILIIFVKNLSPEERYFGDGPFKHIQCAKIKETKEKIRNLYNSYINGMRTEEHVIHASDYESQTDYFLKLLGRKEGVYLFEELELKLPFTKPYHIKTPEKYIFKTLDIKNIRASILIENDNEGISKEIMQIEKTPHFKSLNGQNDTYKEYLKKFQYIYLKDNHSFNNLIKLNQLAIETIRNFEPILVKEIGENYQILDGVHRTAVTLHHGIQSINCVILL